MEHYVWKRRSDGIHIINIRKTWEKLLFAARAIAAIENPSDVVVVSAQPYAQRVVLKFAAHIGATPIVGRFTPGSLTNQIQKNFKQPSAQAPSAVPPSAIAPPQSAAVAPPPPQPIQQHQPMPTQQQEPPKQHFGFLSVTGKNCCCCCLSTHGSRAVHHRG
ncbi:hypothetical protein niasHT_031428 [Heterodera trifolii]|uniref:40S ribosomal protein SA n=1 Tax=Heterodera trifolii TaxID=157864 RepID=A0ABD2HTT0_9BILA